ncbi:prenyltransferase [Nocardioides sp. ChNu-99]|uniref:prenyltransferase n=1 Tax=Nocardioides sp. ChNu-99 TaxID=2839897 RepID=UPI002405E8F6|nr:prenyltransferase [Nocardioides sp. ChNu-99]MDF9716156.1 prenyltransferase [Nocardioides sp. ChNu-99]
MALGRPAPLLEPRAGVVPAVAGVLSAEQVARTAASIAGMQHPDGAIPWTTGDKTDAWNHVEAAMALLVGGEVEAAERAYAWCRANQRADGSWPVKVVGDRVEDDGGETNMSAYVAVGVWHHWLVRRERGFVDRCWPMVRAALDFVVRLQLPSGGVAWLQEWVDGAPGPVREEALLTGSASTYHSLRAGLALAGLVGEPQPAWERAAARLRHAVRRHPEAFLDKATFSMDWYYPVLGGAVRGEEAHALLARRWDDFVVPGLGIRCVDTNPWVTGAETCELVMALDAVGDERAAGLFTDVQFLRDEASGGYFTGYVWPDEVLWPRELTTYTAAAVVLAADQLSGTTPGADIMVGATFGPEPDEVAGGCGC